MNWEKLKPWNWFKKEQNNTRDSLVPVQRRDYESHPLALLHQEMDRVFDSFWRGFGVPAFPRYDSLMGGLLRPSLDIAESQSDNTIRVEVPGVEKGDIQLRLEDDTLVISGEKRQEKEDKDGGYHCIERSYGSFRRLVTLPDDADRDKLEAAFRNGVLTITVPRTAAPAASGRQIAIQ